jgi:carbonic anhydrase/acetyltransferase-like protein (isoleucine patch superfamily)
MPFLPTHLRVDPSVFIAPGAVVVGEVSIGADSSVWYHATVRGDMAPVRIGRESNVQDGAVIHVHDRHPAEVGDRVVIGHRAIVHGARVEDEVLVGMGAILLNGARIGPRSMVGAGAVVPEGFEVPEGSLVLGVPARVVRALSEAEVERIINNARQYVEYARLYRLGELG